ncbi:MAG: hypothetical protein ABID40_06180 [Candidatus Bipolaricaulota bacterium]
MRAAALAVGLLYLGTVGVGLEVAHPALFPSEPLVVWTASGEGAPTASIAGTSWPVAWRQVVEAGRVRWEGSFPAEAPLGVWLVCTDRGCHAFLRVPGDQGLLEVEAAPGATLTLGGQARVGDAAGRAFFVATPGDYELVAVFGNERLTRPVRIRPGQRIRLTLILATAELSTSAALPAHIVTLSVRIVAPRDLPTLVADLVVPEGWEALPNPGLFEPLPAGELTVRSWRVFIPADAPHGEHALTVGLPDLGVEAHAALTVANRLPSRVVVCHWDVTADWLDLSLPCEITYARLLWATAFVGRELPFTGRVFTRSELEALAAEWQKGP